jgi:DNA-binding NarL/FixJ family response regulator
MLQIFIVEPQPHIATMLKAHKNVQVVGTALSTGAVLYRTLACDLILVSARLPAADLLKYIRQQQTMQQIVIADIDETENEILPFLEAGAVGYVRQSAGAAEMVSTLNAIYAGKPPLAPTIGTALVERMHELLALQQQRAGESLLQNCPDLSTLTMREREILVLIRDGASNQDIANQLMIELGTVKNHVHNILKKLNVSRREQAASYVDLLEQTT